MPHYRDSERNVTVRKRIYEWIKGSVLALMRCLSSFANVVRLVPSVPEREHLLIEPDYVQNQSKSEGDEPSFEGTLSDKQKRVVAVALSLKSKVTYVHWHERQEAIPPYKTDCSGFTYLVYKMAGVLIPFPDAKEFSRSVRHQAISGISVGENELLPGDILILVGHSSSALTAPAHCGIYLGNGQMIHNADSEHHVIISNVSDYSSKFIDARRLLY